jgi:hypothetical protein
MENVEIKAGQTLTEQGIPFHLRRLPKKNGLIKRLLRKAEQSEFEEFEIKPLKFGTLIYISEVACDIPDVKEEKTILAYALENPELYRKILLAISYAILNDKKQIEERGKSFAKELEWRLEPQEGFRLWVAITSMMNVESFFFTINLIKGKNLLTTRDTKATAASGVRSEQQLKNTA